MADRAALGLGCGALCLAAALWAVYGLRRREGLARAARGSSVLAALLLAAGLALYGWRVGYWPFYTPYERLTVGLLGLVLAWLTLRLPGDGRLELALACLASLLGIYGLWSGRLAGPAALVYGSGWWLAYVALSAFGGGALVVAGGAVIAGRDQNLSGAVAQRALAWGWLALSAGLACGAWWFHRLAGRYWGDARWAGVAIVWLLTAAVWHARGWWVGRNWRVIPVGAALALLGGYLLLGR